ncbi:hypothetical protein Tco_1179035 [Tanacetum coccineum]
MQIPAWIISKEMKQTKHYRMYVEVFRIDVPLTQSQSTESTQRTHRTPSAPRRSTRLTPLAQVQIVNKADEMILQDILQVSLAEHKSREEQEARENVALVDEHLASEEIKKMVDGQANVVDDSSIPRNDESNILGTRIEPKSNKESPEVEITKDKEVEITKDKEVEITKETTVVDITNIVVPVNVNDEDEEITDEVYELMRREKGNITPCITFLRVRAKSNVLLNNRCEVFNGKLVGGRDYIFLPLWSLLGNILSKRIVNVNKVIDRCDGPLTPTATKILKANLDEVKKYIVDWGGDELYQVSGLFSDQVMVNVVARTCSCKR